MSKRKKSKKKKIVKNKRKIKFFPVVFCQKEDICIGISKKEMGFKGDKFGRVLPRDPVLIKHWNENSCEFRSEEYVIDFSNKKKGEIIICPKCCSLVDFRLFPSSKVPEFKSIKNDKDANS